MTPIQAIKAKCLDCCCGQAYEVKLCPCNDCPLYPFRLGHNPNIKKRVLSDEAKAILAKKMREYNYTAKTSDEANHG